MPITGWRVHFTRRELAWLMEVTPFIREFGGLDRRLGPGRCTHMVDIGSEPAKLDADGCWPLRLPAQG
jgi:hypothetical protein